MDFNYLKARSIFNPVQSSTQMTRRPFDFSQGTDPNQDINVDTPTTQPDQQKSSLTDMYSKLAQMEPGPAQKAYRDFLQTQPNRDDSEFKPGKMSRLSAILAGGSEGIKHGGAAGYETASKILDQPYTDAMTDFKVKGDRLSNAAGLEEKDMSNRVKTYRDFIADDQNKAREARLAKLDQSNIDLHKSNIDLNSARALDLKNKGWTITKNATTGVEQYTRMNPNGQIETKDIGKMDMTPDEKVGFEGKKAGAISHAKLGDELQIAREKGDQARQTMQKKFEGIKDVVKMRLENPNYKSVTDSDGQIILINTKDASDVQYTGIDSGKLSDQQKIDAGLKAKQKLKESDTGKTTTTEIVGGKKVVTTKPNNSTTQNNVSKPPPTGAKPGGKWIDTKYGPVYQEP